MPLFRSRRRAPVVRTTRTTARKPSLLYRLTHSSRNAHPVSTAGTTTTTRHGTRTHRSRRAPVTSTAVARKPTFGDKIHGMFFSFVRVVRLDCTDDVTGAAKVMAGTLTFNRRKKRQGEVMQVQGTASTTARRRRRW